MTESETFIVPDLFKDCPFVFQINPHYQIAKVEADQWLHSYGIKGIEKATKWDFPLLAAMTHSTNDVKRLSVLSNYYQWTFVFDDLFDDGEFSKSPRHARDTADLTISVLRDPETFPKTSFVLAEMLRNFLLEIKKTATGGCYRRLVEHIREYIDAAVQQVINRANDVELDINSYIELRRKTGAIECCFDLIEYDFNLDIPDEVKDDPTIRKLTHYCSDICGWANVNDQIKFLALISDTNTLF